MQKEVETNRDFFNRTAPVFLANYRSSPQFKERLLVWQQAIERVLPHLPDNAICLDLGCGDGTYGRMLARQGIRTICIDQSEAMLEMARGLDLEKGTGSGAEYEQASIPLPSELEQRYAGQIDLILCSSVLEYVADYQGALAQCARLLKSNGKLLLSLPNRQSLYRAWERAAQGLCSTKDTYLRQQLHQFSLRDMKKRLEEMGLNPVGDTYFGLPAQAYSERVFGRYRGAWLATMFLVIAAKRR